MVPTGAMLGHQGRASTVGTDTKKGGEKPARPGGHGNRPDQFADW